MLDRLCRVLAASLIAVLLIAPAARAAGNTYNEEDIVSAAADFFGETTEGLARIVEKVFADLGVWAAERCVSTPRKSWTAGGRPASVR